MSGIERPDPCGSCQGTGQEPPGQRPCQNCLGVGVDPVDWHQHIVWLQQRMEQLQAQLDEQAKAGDAQ